MLEFEWPLVAFAALLPFIIWLLPALKQQQRSALNVPDVNEFQHASTQSVRPSSNWLLWCLALFFYLSLTASAMRPVWIGEPIALPLEGRDLIMAIDLSGSMREQDMRMNVGAVSRIEATRRVASDFVDRRKGDRIGLVVFGEQAYTLTPLTFDLKTVQQQIEEARIGLAGERATVIGDAIGLTLKRLRESEVEDKTLILLTDGVDSGSSIPPLKAAELAAEDDLKIYTIGIGAGNQRSLFRRQNEIDEDTLTKIAEMTGGRYFRARNAKELVEIYKLIDQLEPVESESKTFKPRQSLFHWPLLMAFLWGALLVIARIFRGQS